MRNELIYFRESHKSKVLYSPQLFKVNGIPHEERLVNLCALLAQDEQDSQFTSLPTNAEASLVMENAYSSNMFQEKNDDNIMVGNYYVTLIMEGSTDTWYIASCEGINEDGTYTMDHLMRAEPGSDMKWKHPQKPDITDLHLASIVTCKIDGEWDVSNERSMTFLLRNHNEIAASIKEV